jgi:hypothetical protein
LRHDSRGLRLNRLNRLWLLLRLGLLRNDTELVVLADGNLNDGSLRNIHDGREILRDGVGHGVSHLI